MARNSTPDSLAERVGDGAEALRFESSTDLRLDQRAAFDDPDQQANEPA